jgi:hypothetical protein
MPKLNDTQLVILSTAAQREAGSALPVPDTIKANEKTVASVLKGLVKSGLLAEQPAKPDTPVWHETKDGQRMTLVITDAGLEVIDGEEPAKAKSETPAPSPAGKKPTLAKGNRATVEAKPEVRAGTKLALLIDLLKRKDGASIDEIVAATEWQAHSVRGAISGSVKKKLGLAVISEKNEEQGRVYRIVGKA